MSALGPGGVAFARRRLDLETALAVKGKHRGRVVEGRIAPATGRAVAHLKTFGEHDGVRRAVLDACRVAVGAVQATGSRVAKHQEIAGIIARGQPALEPAAMRAGLVVWADENLHWLRERPAIPNRIAVLAVARSCVELLFFNEGQDMEENRAGGLGVGVSTRQRGEPATIGIGTIDGPQD